MIPTFIQMLQSICGPRGTRVQELIFVQSVDSFLRVFSTSTDFRNIEFVRNDPIDTHYPLNLILNVA
jgi:hypothetical protein